MQKQKKELSTMTMGISGEHYIIADLLRQDCEVFTPVTDQVNTDLVVFLNNHFKRIQVKTVGVYKTKSSVEVRMRDHKKNDHIDYVAIYLWHDNLIAYYPYSGEKNISLALKRAKNNQSSVDRKWFYEYSEIL